jgi:hypothetical protein
VPRNRTRYWKVPRFSILRRYDQVPPAPTWRVLNFTQRPRLKTSMTN